MFKTSFPGGNQLASALRAMPSAVSKKVLKAALMDAGQPMADRMSSLVHRRAPAPDIADNIGVSSVRSLEGVTLNESQAAVSIGPVKGFRYGYFLEYGTVHSRAFPFMRPAFDAVSPQSLGVLADRLWAAIRAHAGKSSSSAGGTGNL